MELYNRENGVKIAGRVIVASSFFRRFRGLMLTRELPQESALHIRPCRSVHTYFMYYPIDVLYLDESGVIVGIEENMQPGRIGAIVPNTRSVVELPAGRIRATETRIGQAVTFVEQQTT
ncbi:DUF192 domain-containing protein [Paenibacillus alkalitolerans]|uniref:DUF192 domain-containing protein n=1 Tax=Paenibacillus alkalitolerans TaxID=2799335 RepID=UPI0018F3DE58|nr:DUF192 domain-containing protein [Paenibacillus alkalitolerans]